MEATKTMCIKALKLGDEILAMAEEMTKSNTLNEQTRAEILTSSMGFVRLIQRAVKEVIEQATE